MPVITVAQITAAFRNIIGWPYASPGSNSQKGIDCSGAFVYAYGLYRESIYHGSNRIIRVYCQNPITITSASQLKAGMAVLKYRTDLSGLNAEYKPGGKYYNASLPYDYYHIGLVVSVNPLQIIHATTPVAKMDTNLSGGWRVGALLKAVSYDTTPPDPTPTPAPQYAVTAASTGSTVNLRRSPSTSSVVLVRVPLGKTVTVNSVYNSTWWNVTYQKTTGYMMSEFLNSVAGTTLGASVPAAGEVGPTENA